jgi:hypothetical protein
MKLIIDMNGNIVFDGTYKEVERIFLCIQKSIEKNIQLAEKSIQEMNEHIINLYDINWEKNEKKN